MTEKQVEDVTKGRDLSTSIDELEHLREHSIRFEQRVALRHLSGRNQNMAEHV